jgi:hypothetical protein
VRFLGWLLDHLPTLLSFGFGFAVAVNNRAELALGFFILGILGEVSRELFALRKDVKALRDRAEEQQR